MPAKAGWYPASTNPSFVQWWDGKSWAEAFWRTSIEAVEYLPTARRFDISTRGEPRYDIVGENWREREILSAIGHESTPRDVEFEGYGVAELVPEPDNPHDPFAVSVRIAGFNVGYLPAHDARAYAGVIAKMVSGGVVPTVRARVWGVTRFVRSRAQDELKSAIRVALPQPSDILPSNAAPKDPHAIIPRGRSIQVTGEEEHFDVLASALTKAKAGSWVVTLHSIDAGKKTPTSVLEVRLDGARVGQLTPAMSTSIGPMVREAESKGLVAAAWASIAGSHLAAEVTLHVAKSEEVPTSWPAETDSIPDLELEPVSLPPAYRPQADITPAPSARGLHGALWVLGIIAALFLFAIPYVGPLVGLAGIGALVWWHFWLTRKAPRGSPTRLDSA